MRHAKPVLAIIAIFFITSLRAADEKPLTIEGVSIWQKQWRTAIFAEKNPIARRELEDKRQEELKDKVAGKEVEGLAVLVFIRQDENGGPLNIGLTVIDVLKRTHHMRGPAKDANDAVWGKLKIDSVVHYKAKVTETCGLDDVEIIVEKPKKKP